MIESIPSIVASMEYDKHAVDNYINNHFNELQKELAKDLSFHKAISDYLYNGSFKTDIVKALTDKVMTIDRNILENNEKKLLT